MSPASDSEKFARVVEALRPWLPAVVIAGGWAHRLHRLHHLAEAPVYLPLMTKDVDVAVGSSSSLSEGNLRESLLAAGFREEMTGERQPPVTYYHIGDEEHLFYVEFLTPLLGSEHRRGGTPDVTMRLGGISAQKVRHLDLLLLAPWPVTIGTASGFPLDQSAIVRVPNPAAYVAQKLLVLPRRRREDRERDVLYVHDTLQTFGRHLSEVRDAWHTDVAPGLSARRVAGVRACVRGQFAEVTDLIRGAAEIGASVGRSVSPESILEVCQVGLEGVFL